MSRTINRPTLSIRRWSVLARKITRDEYLHITVEPLAMVVRPARTLLHLPPCEAARVDIFLPRDEMPLDKKPI